jgi:hypothetical protein
MSYCSTLTTAQVWNVFELERDRVSRFRELGYADLNHPSFSELSLVRGEDSVPLATIDAPWLSGSIQSYQASLNLYNEAREELISRGEEP